MRAEISLRKDSARMFIGTRKGAVAPVDLLIYSLLSDKLILFHLST